MKPVCIVCSFRPLTVLGRFLGFSPISMTCSTNSQPCSFVPSWGWILLSLLQNVALLALMLANLVYFTPEWIFQQLNQDVPSTNITTGVFVAIEFIQFFSAVMLLFFNIFQCKTKARSLEKIARYLHHAGPGVDRSISQKDEDRLFWIAVRQSCTIILVTICNIVYVLLVFPGKDIFSSTSFWLTIKSFANGICTAMILIGGFEVSETIAESKC